MTDEQFFNIFPFEKPRKLQRKVIDAILNSYEQGYKHVVLQAPTGIGKSVIGLSIANWFAFNKKSTDPINSAYILTSQKLLQEQYVSDFSIPTVKGRANYPCTYSKKADSAKDGTCITRKWNRTQREKKCPRCPYYTARDAVYGSSISILNYAYFLNMGVENNDLQTKRKLLILDECHNLEMELINFSTVIFNPKELAYYDMMGSILNFPEESNTESEKLNWLFNIVFPELKDEYRHTESYLESLDPNDYDFKKIFKKKDYLKTLLCNIQNLLGEYQQGYPCVVIQNDKNISFKPIFGKNLAKQYLIPFSDITLSMSATVLSKEQYCRDMGFDKNETMFIKLPSLFPKKNHPVHSLCVGSMSYKNKNETKPKLLKVVERILNKHKNERGIIHTVNYEIAEYILTNIDNKFRDRLIMPKGKTRETEIEYFMTSSKDNLVLISPSLQEGIDLKNDLSRFTIICKVPYASLADPWVKKRMDLSPKWYSDYTCMSLIQMTGRSVRTETDFAVSYILDSDFKWFFSKNKNKFPKHWKELIV